MESALPQWCTNCGDALSGARFCANCGQPAPASPDTVVAPSSGVSLHKPTADPSAATMARADLVPPPAIPPPPGWQPPPPAWQPPPIGQPPPVGPRQEPRRRPWLLLGLALVVLLALVGVGAAAYLLGRENRTDDTVAQERTGAASNDPGATAGPTDGPTAGSTDGGGAASEAAGGDTAVEPEALTIRDASADTSKGNRGPKTAAAGDIVSVDVHPQIGDDAGWVDVHFADRDPGGSGVLVWINTDTDPQPEYVAWRNTSTGAAGSAPVSGWQAGRDTLDGPAVDDSHFTGALSGGGEGVVFPMAFEDGELDGGRLRVNVQVINPERHYDYAPQRHQWTAYIQFRAEG